MDTFIVIAIATVLVSTIDGTLVRWESGQTGVVLGEIPWGLLPNDTTDLRLAGNNLRTIGVVPTENVMEKLWVNSNSLTEFPDVRNMRNTLTRLALNRNPITRITPPERLSELHMLETLSMRYCPILALPEVKYLPARLEVLNVDHTMLSALPNLCEMNYSESSTGTLELAHADNSYVCDKHMIWAKLAKDLARVSIAEGDDARCHSPEHLNGSTWESLKIADLLPPEENLPMSRSSVFRSLDPASFYCYPRVTHVLPPEVAMVDCASLCLGAEGCMLFAVDGGQCVLTAYKDGVLGTVSGFALYEQWYSVTM